MARTRLQLPASFSFSTLLPVRITDVNYGGHVGNDTILTLLHEARVQYIQSLGFTELNFGGPGLIMADVGIEFRNEVFYGTILKAYVTINEFSGAGFDIYYKLVTAQEEQVVAVAKTGMVCYDYNLKKVVAVPEAARKKIQG